MTLQRNKTVWESSLDYGLRTLRLAIDTHGITSHFAMPLRMETPGGQSLSSGQLAKVNGFTDLDGSQPDAWRYVVDVQDAGKAAHVTGYR